MKKVISNLNKRTKEITQNAAQKDNESTTLESRNILDKMRKFNISILGVQKGKNRGNEDWRGVLKEKVIENVQEGIKDTDIYLRNTGISVGSIVELLQVTKMRVLRRKQPER